MNPSPLTALSPLDGRYAAKVAPLRPLLSEFGLMHRRVMVEVEWFIALSDAGLAEFKPLSDMRASSAYRRAVLGNLLRRGWQQSQPGALALADLTMEPLP